METLDLNIIVELLKRWLSETELRQKLAYEFEDWVGNRDIVGATKEQLSWLDDLCVEFSYYSRNPVHLKEEPALKDDIEMEKLVREILSKVSTSHG